MSLQSRILPVSDLTSAQIDVMFALLRASYDCVERDRFLHDLSWKHEVILLLDADERIQGFTTLAFNPKGGSYSHGDILFSGDTIVDPAHWGSLELVQAFCRRAGEWQSQSGRRLFWMLISKGHRTYLFLPLFAKRFFPHPERMEFQFERIAHQVAERLFGRAWNRKRGVVQFGKSLGQLKPHLAATSWQRSNSPMVTYFLQRNPGFEDGDELVCLTELSVSNLKRSALRCFEEGVMSHA